MFKIVYETWNCKWTTARVFSITDEKQHYIWQNVLLRLPSNSLFPTIQRNKQTMSKSTLGNYNFLLHYFVPKTEDRFYIRAARPSSLLSRCLLFIPCCRKVLSKVLRLGRTSRGLTSVFVSGLLNIWVALVVAADWKDQEARFKLQSLCAWEVKGPPKNCNSQHFCLSSEMTVILAAAPPLLSVGFQTPSSFAYPLYSHLFSVCASHSRKQPLARNWPISHISFGGTWSRCERGEKTEPACPALW